MTEISIARSGRRDGTPSAVQAAVQISSSTATGNNGVGASQRGRSAAQQSDGSAAGVVTRPTASGALQNEAREQRKRSSSHSDAQGMRGNGVARSGNNNSSGNTNRIILIIHLAAL